MKVEVRELKRHFDRTRAVDGISFTFSSGQVFGFIGPNGAGKTTTMRILATLDEPTAGDATIDGRSVVEEPEHARRLVGFMPDTLPTHADVSVHDYLDFFARAYGARGEKRRRVIESVEEFTNLTGLREKMLKALSKGMKQRVSLARAIVHDPPLLVLDEPASGLDPRARVELRELLKALAARGKAILISSHILTELAEVCDGAVIIEGGKIVAAGTMREIAAGPGAGAPRTVVAIRVLGDLEALHRRLLQTPGVDAARLAGGAVEAELQGGEEAAADLLAHLVGAGVRVVEFKERRAQLEEVFLAVTRGDVQ
jgi:ABC-2 type transport system ATP-binding protein